MAQDFLNSAGDYFEFDTCPVFDTQNTGFTIAFWLNPDSASYVRFSYLLSAGVFSGTSSINIFFQDAAGPATLRMNFVDDSGNNSGNFNIINGDIVADEWQHVCFTFDSSNETIYGYRNGVQTDSSVESGMATTISPTTAFRFLDRYDAGTNRNASASMADLAIWSRHLEDPEIEALGIHGFAASMVAPDALTHYVPMIRDVKDVKGGAVTDVGSAHVDHPRIIYPADPRYSIITSGSPPVVAVEAVPQLSLIGAGA